MPRTITVKAIGNSSAKPDYVVLSMHLETQEMEYDKANNSAALRIQHLTETLMSLGFDKTDLKTTNFNIDTDYNNEKDRNGNYHRVFNGYNVIQDLKLSFDFDTNRLATALSAISRCISNPELSIRFTIKDATAVNEEMLRSATANAKRKAEILCEASGVELGQLIAIDYNWGELDVYSHTRYDMADECLAAPMMERSIEIEPDDIETTDTATFVWEIK